VGALDKSLQFFVYTEERLMSRYIELLKNPFFTLI